MALSDWFEDWQTVPWGPGGDGCALACPRANHERPNRTPDCYIEIDRPQSMRRLHALAVRHRREHGY